MACLKLHEARDFNIYSKRMLLNRPKFEPLNPKDHTYLGIKNKILTLWKGDCHLQLVATFSLRLTSNSLVVGLSEVLAGIPPSQSYVICDNDCRSQSLTVGRCSGLALT